MLLTRPKDYDKDEFARRFTKPGYIASNVRELIGNRETLHNSSGLDEVINFLVNAERLGNDIFIEFEGNRLHSKNITVDGAYLIVTGKTRRKWCEDMSNLRPASYDESEFHKLFILPGYVPANVRIVNALSSGRRSKLLPIITGVKQLVDQKMYNDLEVYLAVDFLSRIGMLRYFQGIKYEKDLQVKCIKKLDEIVAVYDELIRTSYKPAALRRLSKKIMADMGGGYDIRNVFDAGYYAIGIERDPNKKTILQDKLDASIHASTSLNQRIMTDKFALLLLPYARSEIGQYNKYGEKVVVKE